MIKKIAVGLGAVSVLAMTSGAWAANSGTIDINVTVPQFIEVDIINPVLAYNVVDVTQANNNATGGPRAKFSVTANVDHQIDVDFPTFADAGGCQQAQFMNSTAGYAIGGALWLDPTPDLGGGVSTNLVRQTSAGDLWVNKTGKSSGPANTVALDATLGGGTHTWAIGADIGPQVISDTSVDVAAPGVYSLTATITATVF